MPRPSSNPPKDPPSGEGKSAAPTLYGVGEAIVQSGIYRVLHAGHRISHYVVLLAGEIFPRCARCGDQVRFELFEATTDLQSDPDFHIRVYEIPHPPPAPGEDKEDEVA